MARWAAGTASPVVSLSQAGRSTRVSRGIETTLADLWPLSTWTTIAVSERAPPSSVPYSPLSPERESEPSTRMSCEPSSTSSGRSVPSLASMSTLERLPSSVTYAYPSPAPPTTTTPATVQAATTLARWRPVGFFRRVPVPRIRPGVFLCSLTRLPRPASTAPRPRPRRFDGSGRVCHLLIRRRSSKKGCTAFCGIPVGAEGRTSGGTRPAIRRSPAVSRAGGRRAGARRDGPACGKGLGRRTGAGRRFRTRTGGGSAVS